MCPCCPSSTCPAVRDAVYFSNRSAAYANCSKFDEALQDAQRVLKLKPGWVKGHARTAAAYMGLELYSEAKEAYEKAVKLEPDDQVRLGEHSLLQVRWGCRRAGGRAAIAIVFPGQAAAALPTESCGAGWAVGAVLLPCVCRPACRQACHSRHQMKDAEGGKRTLLRILLSCRTWSADAAASIG